MRVAHPLLLVLAFASAASAQTPAPLDYDFFKTRVQPIFLAERPGHARCIACHGSGTPMRLQPLAAGRDDLDRRRVAQELRRSPADGGAGKREEPAADASARGIGGRRLLSQRRQALELAERSRVADAQGMGDGRQARRRCRTPCRGSSRPTARATTSTSSIRPRTRSSAIIRGIEAGHGAGAAPDGSRIYISDEAESTLDIVDAKTLAIVKKVPLSGHPNNMAVGKDGRRVYVGIIQAPGGVDVIDTASMQRVKTVPTQGTIHNAYVTPDGRYVVAGSIAGATINVIDATTEEPAWTLKMDLGIRPMTFNTNPDGSTKWIFAQLTGFNGFAVVDFATRKEIDRIKNPPICRRERRPCPKAPIRRTAWRSPPTARRSSSAAG